jgi:hypothetical protein
VIEDAIVQNNEHFNQETAGRGLVLVLVLAIELLGALLLLIPQALEHARSSQALLRLRSNLPRLERLPQAISDLEGSLKDNRHRLLNAKAVKLGNAEEIIMMAVAQALDDTEVALLGLAPEGGNAAECGPESLKLQCRGTYSSLVAFLGKLEQHGLLISSRRFQMHVEADGEVRLEAVLQAWSEKSLQESMVIFKEEQAKNGHGSKKGGRAR